MTPHYEDPVIRAQAAVAAEAHAAAAQAALAAAEGDADAIRRRILDLDGQRGAIVIRRTHGEERPTDGPDLAVIAADKEGLEGLLREREAAVAAARAPAEAAASALANARLQLRRSEALSAEAAMAEHADSLQAKLLETLAQLAEIGRQIGRGGRSIWFPSQRLSDALTRLSVQHQRGW